MCQVTRFKDQFTGVASSDAQLIDVDDYVKSCEYLLASAKKLAEKRQHTSTSSDDGSPATKTPAPKRGRPDDEEQDEKGPSDADDDDDDDEGGAADDSGDGGGGKSSGDETPASQTDTLSASKRGNPDDKTPYAKGLGDNDDDDDDDGGGAVAGGGAPVAKKSVHFAGAPADSASADAAQAADASVAAHETRGDRAPGAPAYKRARPPKRASARRGGS